MQTDIITRLWWDGGHGVARHDGVTVDLHAAPVLGRLHLAEIDYAPAVRVAQLRESAQRWRDMNAAERQAADELLGRIASAARAAATPDTQATEPPCQTAP